MTYTLVVMESGVAHKLTGVTEEIAKDFVKWWKSVKDAADDPDGKKEAGAFYLIVIGKGESFERALGVSLHNVAAFDILPEKAKRPTQPAADASAT